MNTHDYKGVQAENHSKLREKESTNSILRQAFISSAVWTQYFMVGLCVGAPTVFIPQINKEAKSTVIDEELGSWLYSTSGFSMSPWLILLPLITKRYGRKLPIILTSLVSMVIFTILYYSENPYQILISEVIQGFLYAGNITIRIHVVTDYSSPKYRGFFLTIKSASFIWGIWIANAIGTFYHWKNIAALGFICSIFTLHSFFWHESPSWLASKGRFEDCKKSFRWIHGLNVKSEAELKQLIETHTERINAENISGKIGLLEMVQCREFYAPLLLSVACVVQYQFSGKVVCSLYILDIFKSISNNESAAYRAMLILDGITVFGMYIGAFLSRILRRRTLYMTSSFLGLGCLFLISLYLFLVRLKVFDENQYITVVLLGFYSLSISCGPLLWSLAIYGELISSKFQAISYVLVLITFGISYSPLIKIFPLILNSFGIDGTFLFYSITFGVCTLYLYRYLPETKNMTQLQIEHIFKSGDSKIRNVDKKVSKKLLGSKV